MNQIANRPLTALALAGAHCGTAVAASSVTTRMIEANYMDIRVVVDGIEITPTDANGNVVEPFASEGTTYLPVRAIGEALGKPVTWDGTTATIYVGDVPGQETNWMVDLPPYQVNETSKIYDGSDPKSYFTTLGQDYTAGVVLKDTAFDNAYALWNTNLQYDTMTFKVSHVDGADDYDMVLSIYLDGNYYTEYDIPFNGGARTITVPLDRAANVDIRMNAHSYDSDGAKFFYSGAQSHYAIYDISFS